MSKNIQGRHGHVIQKPGKVGVNAVPRSNPQPWRVYGGVVFLMAYVLAVTFAPILDTLDTNTSRFFILSGINVFSFVVMFAGRRQFGSVLGSFMGHWLSIVYFLLLVVALISFTQALNVSESVVSWSKMFTGFSGALIVYVVVAGNKKVVDYLAIGLTLLLLYDSFGVFSSILKYITASDASIYEIKSVYGNKNIYSAVILVKIPFALWLYAFRRDFARWVGLFGVFCGMVAILFLSARASYLGIIAVALSYLFYSAMPGRHASDRSYWMHPLIFAGMLVVVYGVFTFVQSELYPKSKEGQKGEIYTAPVAQRLATITTEKSSDRLYIWKNTLRLYREHPLLGVGIGNWKVAVLKYENETSPDFVYKYKVHNDFFRSFAETGVAGGVLYFLIHLIVMLSFWVPLFRRRLTAEAEPLLFLGSFGLMAYFFDAFFNFPHDRPEMLMFLSIYSAFSIAGALTRNEEQSSWLVPKFGAIFKNRWVPSMFLVFMILLGSASFYVLYCNFKSAQAQAIVYRLYKTSKLTKPADEVIAGFPAIPEITVLGEPVNSNKAFVLLHEKRYDEAIALLKADHTSPYDSRREHYTAMAYFRQEKWDSAIVWAQQAYKLKPYLLPNVGVLCTSLQKTGKLKEASAIINKYLDRRKNESKAWLLAGEICWNMKDYEGAVRIVDSAERYLPNNDDIRRASVFYKGRSGFFAHEKLFNDAVGLMDKSKFSEAINVLDQFISLVPEYSPAWERKAYCNYSLKNYREVIGDVNRAISLDKENFSLINLRGVGYHVLGKRDSACADFKRAMDKGRADAADNYRKFCEQIEPGASKTKLLPAGKLK